MSETPMTCKDALVVLIGGADTHTRETLLRARAHASRCPHCSSAYDSARTSGAGSLAVPGFPVPALSIRAGLLTVAIVQLVLAVPWLVGRSLTPDADVAVSHLTRDGALGLVAAAVALVAVWRPRYVHVSMLVGSLVLALQLVAGVADQQSSSVKPSFEFVHLPIVLIVVGLFAAAASMTRRATPRAEPRSSISSRPPLVSVARGSRAHDGD